jgi:class 3 adenylate cyclase/alpha-beta hydrolase superfamily lysophospholipase
MEVPETRYAKSGDVHVAYQVFGSGAIDLLIAPGWVSHLEHSWEEPSLARFLERLGSFARVVWFDKRGTGLSDRVAGVPILEERTDDLRAVLDAAGVRRAAILGFSEGGSMSALFAAIHPERVTALVLFGAFARRIQSSDYPWAPPREERDAWIQSLEAGWGGDIELATLAPSRVNDPAFRKWFAAFGRLSASPATAVALARMNSEIDIREVLPSIHAPTLVLHRRGDRDVDIGNGRYLAAHIPGARFVELPGEDHLWWTSDDEGLLEVQEFLTGVRARVATDRVLLTLLFTDIVRSTQQATALGDERWRELLVRHNQMIRKELGRFAGHEVKTTGDGMLATFDGPARAIRCAEAIRRAARELPLQIRLGIHTGECEVVGEDVAGVSVHVAARVSALSDGSDLLVTGTVKDLVAGSGIEFRDRGLHALKGLEGERQLYEVVSLGN